MTVKDICNTVFNPGSSQQEMVHCGHDSMNMVSSNTQVDCGVSIRLSCYSRVERPARKISPTPLHQHQQPELRLDVVYAKF